MPIIPRFQQESDPNQPPRIDFGDRLMQGMVAGAQAQRFAAEADYRRQMAAIQQEELGMAREQRAMAQQERQDLAKMEEFFAVRQAGAQQPPMQQQEPQPSPLVSPAPAMGGILSPVTPSDLEGAKLFASQLGSDSARAMFFNRYREVLKNDVVMADVRKTQDAYSNLIAGVKSNQNFVDPSTGQSIFDTEITNLATLLDTLDDQGQTAESRAATTSAVMQAVNQLQKMANEEETRITRYGVTMNSLDAAIKAVKPNSPEAKALIERRSQFKNRPKATAKEIDDVETSISNISAGRTQYSEKLGDWFTPDERVRRESEMEMNQRKNSLMELQANELRGQIELIEMSRLESALKVESRIQELTSYVYDGQFLTDDTGARTKDLAIDPQSFRSREAIEADFRSKLDKISKSSVPRGTMESARAEGEDIAASIAGDIVGGGEQKPPTPPPATPQKEAMPVDTADIEEMKSMRQRLADTGLGSKEKLAAYDKRISDAESANQRYADLSKKYQGQPLELEVRRRAALNEGRTDEAEEISYLIGIKSQGWWANLTPGTIGWDELSSLSDEELANEYAGFKRRVESFERRRAARQAYVNYER